MATNAKIMNITARAPINSTERLLRNIKNVQTITIIANIVGSKTIPSRLNSFRIATDE